MSKFSGTTRRPLRTNLTAPIRTSQARTFTHEGGEAFLRDAESELFLLAATNMVGEDTFYERADTRDRRFVDLVHRVTVSNPTFIAGADVEAGQVGLAQYLRQSLQMRSAAVVMAAEYVAAGGANGRSVVARALQRPDEPAELLGYWLSTHGRAVPMAIKRGIADTARRLYTERAALRYDGLSRQTRMADVIELTHPSPRDERQSALFRWLLDRRHHDDARADPDALPLLANAAELDAVPVDERRALLRARGPALLTDAGFSWERLSGWLPGGMDAEAWEAVIPSMGVMALVRNLRNFDQAGISETAIDAVIATITDAESVAKARLFPYQVWAAYQAAPSDNWKRALGPTIDLTVANIPALDGTLVVIDTSGSMQATVSGRSAMTRVEVAAVMAMATAKRASNVDVVIYGDTNKVLRGLEGGSVLAGVDRVVRSVGSVGHATFGHSAIARRFDPKRHQRAIIFTDDQQHDSGHVRLDHVPLIYTFNLAGYRPSALPAGERGRYTLGGFSDATFTVMQVLESRPRRGVAVLSDGLQHTRHDGGVPEIPPLPTSTILLVEVGSTAHGTGLPGGEDHDEMGVVVETPEQILGLDERGFRTVMHRTQPEGVQSGPGDTDRTLHSLRRFVRLAATGNPSILMAMWAPVLHSTALGLELRALGDAFVGRHVIPRYRGYMESQASRLLGLRGGGHGRRGGGLREELVAEHGFDTKYAMHAARLGFQGVELLTTRHLSLPIEGEPAEWLRAVRRGEVVLDEWWNRCLELDAQLEALAADADIPDRPDRDRIERWLVQAHQTAWTV